MGDIGLDRRKTHGCRIWS